jgi:hypothetical protein
LLINRNTVFFETILIRQTDNKLFYITTVTDQNNGKSIGFKLISNSNGIIIFENKEPDFPQRIVYTNPKADSLNAYIEGSQDGEYRKSEFAFIKNKK